MATFEGSKPSPILKLSIFDVDFRGEFMFIEEIMITSTCVNLVMLDYCSAAFRFETTCYFALMDALILLISTYEV